MTEPLDLLRELVEIESPTFSAGVRRVAERVAAAFVVEPPGPRGELKTARKGLGRFRLTVTGRPAHVASRPREGVSAIEELAHQVLALQGVDEQETAIAVNVGVIRGGT